MSRENIWSAVACRRLNHAKLESLRQSGNKPQQRIFRRQNERAPHGNFVGNFSRFSESTDSFREQVPLSLMWIVNIIQYLQELQINAHSLSELAPHVH
jgi:hypothetical protein